MPERSTVDPSAAGPRRSASRTAPILPDDPSRPSLRRRTTLADSLRAILERQAARLGERPLVSLPDGSLTYGQTDRLANRMAAVLAGLGCADGETVAVLCGNRVAMLAAWFGCAKLGAAFMPVNALLTGAPLAAIVGHARARVAVCDPALLPVLDAVRGELPALRHVLVPGERARIPAWAVALDPLLDGVSAAPRPPLAGDVGAGRAKLMYTSGTTGLPKGVVWSRTCEAEWAEHYGDELVCTGPGETAYTPLPLFHVTAQGTVLASLWRGGRAVVDDGFDPLRFWRRVREEGAVVFTFVGTILAALARRSRRPDDLDNPVRRIVGAAAPADRWREVEERFGVEILETWGQTETASCWMHPRRLPSPPGRVGTPSARWEARLVGPDGEPVGDGEPGELLMRPRRPRVMFDGYLGPAGELELPYDAQGWYRTGDLMVRHPEGDYGFVGRLREAIRRRGELIPAAVVEGAAAAADPTIAEAAAVGVAADDGVEQEVMLWVAPAPGATVDPMRLHARLARLLPAFMVPRYIAVVSALPTTPTNRVRKVELAARGTAGAWDARRRLPPVSGG